MTAPQNLKFLKLKRRLGMPYYVVVGLLESLWLFTQTNAPHGDIGRHTNEDIASGIEWDGDHDKLINDLISCGWVDECPENRLLIHDWEDHVPNYLKGAMAKNGQQFASHGYKPAKHGARQTPKQPAKHGARQNQNDPEQPAPSLALSGLALPCVEIPLLPPPPGDGETSMKPPSPSKPKPPKEPKPKAPRQPNPLFDAIAEVTGLDSHTAGSQIGAVASVLANAQRPYTPEDVAEFGRRFRELCPYVTRDVSPNRRPTPGEIQKNIGLVRASQTRPVEPPRIRDIIPR